MKPWLERRAKTRKNGRTVVVTSVVFDTEVFEELCHYVDQDKSQRSEIVNKAVRDALATPGWIASAVARPAESRPVMIGRSKQPPSSNSRIHARGGINGPTTKKSPSPKSVLSKRGKSQPSK
jgi:hypothetical protein